MVSRVALQNESAGNLPRVLILLATYNGAQWLGEQVESILAQRGVEVNIVIGDDLSSDATRSLVTERWGGDSRVTLHAWDHSSGSAGANFRRLYRLVDPSGFDLVALADQDDIWATDKLGTAATAMRTKGAAGYSCSVTSFWADGRERVVAQRPIPNGGDFLFEGAGQGCTFVVSAALFARVRQFCTDHVATAEALHYHDWLIYLLSRAWGLDWYFDAAPKMRYRQHDGNEIGSRGGFGSISKRIALVRNGWYRRQVQAAGHIYLIAHEGESIVRRFLTTLEMSDTFSRRVSMAWFCLRHGRRRFSDRTVLVISALAGWL